MQKLAAFAVVGLCACGSPDEFDVASDTSTSQALIGSYNLNTTNLTTLTVTTTTHDFGDGAGAVPAHQHSNGGGWVAETAVVDPLVFVASTAAVYQYAQITNNSVS